MKNLNKKVGVLIACSLFILPAFAMADQTMGDQDMSNSDQNIEDNQMNYTGGSRNFDERTGEYRNHMGPNHMGSGMMMGSGMGLTSEQKTALEELKKSLEESIKYLREHITADNVEEIKTKAESLKAEYIAKMEELGLPQMTKMIEGRFEIFYQNNFGEREEKKQIKDEFKQNMDGYKKEFKQNKQAKEEFKNKKQDLVAKYKSKFAKQLDSKLADLSSDRLKTIIAKVDVMIEKYTNTDLKQEQKDKFIAQLTALKQLLQDKLDELENSINIDELLAE